MSPIKNVQGGRKDTIYHGAFKMVKRKDKEWLLLLAFEEGISA